MAHTPKNLRTTRFRLGQPPRLTLCVVADFHDGDPAPVLEAVSRARPDLILLPGDTLERNDPAKSPVTREEMLRWRGLNARQIRVERFLNRLDGAAAALTGGRRPQSDSGLLLIEGLVRIAPTVLSVGNHEWYFEAEDLRRIRGAGALLLDNADTELTVRGRRLRVGGLSTRYDLAWLETFAAKDGEKILLCHHPEHYPRLLEGRAAEAFSLILSGHMHGGQWRLFGRPLYGPGIGLFPDYALGCYDGRLVVSAGVTNSTSLPRLFNPCEIVVVEWGPSGPQDAGAEDKKAR